MMRKLDIPAHSLLTRLAKENRQMGIRLAQLEFREMQIELDNASLFDLKIDFPDVERPKAPSFTSIIDQKMSRRLPVLSVPLGKISWTAEPGNLPVIGVFCADTDHGVLRRALLDLMRTHHAKPFARLVFVSASLRPIPFLGRYGFAYEYLGDQDIGAAGDRLAARYGIDEIRDLVDSSVVWRRPADQTVADNEIAQDDL